MFSAEYMGFYVIGVLFAIIGMIVSGILKNKFRKYSQIGLTNGLSGKEMAQKMLDHYGITDVEIKTSQGFLTDHYNPMDKTVNLSPDVYEGRSISAAAVACHECGHAVQHAQSYFWLKPRTALVPLLKFGSGPLLSISLIVGAGLVASGGTPIVLVIGIAILVAMALFSLVTLPVEFDASKRALAWLDQTGTLTNIEHDGARDALKWAAMTYVVAAIGAVVNALYWILVLVSSRD